jgi:PEP-CTERM motif
MRKLVLLLTLLAAAVPGLAGPVPVNFISFNNTGQWQNGYPYYLFVQGFGPIPVMCDDYVHGGDPDYAWLANETNLGSKDLSLTRFGDMKGALTLYDEAGWLLLETRAQGLNQWKDMTYAVWNIFDPASPCGSGCSFWLAAAENEAAKGFPGINFNLVGILTPVNQHDPDPYGPQEFLYFEFGVPPNAISNPSPGPTPEPGTVVLFATGLAACWRGRRIFRP